MLHPSLTRRRNWAGGLACLLGVGLVLQCLSVGRAQGLIEQVLATPGDGKPVQLYADEIFTWQEGSQKVFLLRGKVWVEQGLASLRVQEGVVWVNQENQAGAGPIYRLEVFGEGSQAIPAILNQGTEKRSAERLLVKLTTRDKVAFKSFNNKITSMNLATAPIYQRGLAIRGSGPASQAAPTTAPASLPKPSEVSPGKMGVPGNPALTVSNAKAESQPAPQGNVVPANLPPGEGTQGIQQTSSKVFGQGPSLPATPVAQGPGEVLPGTPPPLPATPEVLPPPAQAPGIIPFPVPPPQSGPTPPRQLNIRPRSSKEIQAIKQLLPNGETAIIVPTGIIVTITSPLEKKVLLDIEADSMVFWTRGHNSPDLFNNMKGPQGESNNSMEFYFAGNVEIRNQTSKETQILRAQEAYYDVHRNVAIAIKGDLEIRSPKTPQPLHFKGEELLQLGPKLFQSKRSEAFATILPSDPGLKVQITEATLEELDTPRTSIFGLPIYNEKTGQPITTPQRILSGKNAWLNLEGVPIFYFPYFRTDAEDPLGPLDGIGFNYSRIFGFQVMSTWNVFDLLGVSPDPGKRWQLFADYMTLRGPALGTQYQTAGKDWLGFHNQYEGLIKAYGIYDHGEDRLGGDRGTRAYTGPYTYVPIEHPDWRGRVRADLNIMDMPEGFSFQGQVALISDRNFLEQFFHNEWNNDLNQETFAYLKQQHEQWAWTLLAEDRVHREWITETNWLPKADGYLLGISIFDKLTYNLHASAGYAQLKTTNVPSFAYMPTDVNVNTGRFDLWQDISLPLTAGPFKIVPYLNADLAYYTSDVSGDGLGRLYGGAGVRASLPMSRLYSDVQSDLFNLNGLFHKIVFSGNYYYAQSSTHINQLPQLDRLNDDASDQALRDIFPRQSVLNPSNAAFLTTSTLFDPQYYALRRLIDNRTESLDDIDVFQMGIRQRLQTKRGFPGNEHVVDWMTLDVQASVFPQNGRDNYGQTFGVIQYDWLWNVGDRDGLVSNGWFETMEGGPRVFNFGVFTNRPDRTNLYLGYRQIDPLLSKAVIASATYSFSAKYAVTASSLYDFGVHNQINTVMLTRIGTDLRFSLGFSYNSILNNFNVLLEIVPNLLPNTGRFSGFGSTGGNMVSSR